MYIYIHIYIYIYIILIQFLDDLLLQKLKTNKRIITKPTGKDEGREREGGTVVII